MRSLTNLWFDPSLLPWREVGRRLSVEHMIDVASKTDAAEVVDQRAALVSAGASNTLQSSHQRLGRGNAGPRCSPELARCTFIVYPGTEVV